ncbi:MAG TPA: S8 family serine peptidase [Thermoplasmata archaeon]|nr:S8 family serine peptidase [Thermoplasmata archaeon]
MLIGSFGLVPVSAVVAALPAANLAVPTSTLSAAARGLQLVDSVGMRSLRLSTAQNVEVILGLQGRSLGEEQDYRAQNGLPPLDAAAQQAYVASLAQAQAPVVAALKAAGATVRYQYHFVYNGIDVVGGRAALAQVIPQLPGVQRVDLAQQENLNLDASVPFIFDGATYEQLGGNGSGVTIALIDTGIDYTHATFGGPGTLAAYQAIDPTKIDPSYFPTKKVIGGYDLVGENYDARGATAPGGTCSATPVPDPNPLDVNGHGTHTASTAAGMEVRNPETNALLTPHGVAPGALLYEYKVFSGCAADGTASTSNANVIAAIEMAVDPDGDGNTADHAMVISMSLGSDFGRDTTPDAVASNAAVDLGAIVVASAGNAGNIPYITGSPATGSKVISVAAGNDPKIHIQYLGVTGTSGGAADGNKVAVEAAITPPLATIGKTVGLTAYGGLGCSAYTPGEFAGMIPLIERGICTFHEKILDAQNAGAIGVVVFDNRVEAPIVMGGDSTGLTIPAVFIGQADGLAINAALTASTTFTLDPTNILPIPNQLAAFTSAGPRFGDSAFKPDLTAPGVEILSAQVATGTGSTPVSGTSFSAPHIAGASAILREIHPDWSVEEIKDVLMNTATDASPDGTPYPVALMGAGRVRVDVAAMAQSIAMPGGLSFGVKQDNSGGWNTYTQWLTVENKGDHTARFSLSAAFRDPSENDGSIRFSFPNSVTVPAHHSKMVPFMVKVNFARSSLSDGILNEIDGFLTLTQKGGGDVLRVPFLIIPIPRADVETEGSGRLKVGSSLQFENDGLRASGIDVYQFGVQVPRQNLLPGEPSDWMNIRYTGARAYDVTGLGRVLEFGVSMYGLRSSSSGMQTDILISVNGDTTPDYDVIVADLGALTTGTVNGVMVTAVVSLSTGNAFLEFLVDSENNVAWETAPVLVGDINALGGPTIDTTNQTISYFVVTTDLQTGFQDVSGSATFNVIHPTFDVDVNSFVLNAGAEATIHVVASGKSGGFLVLLENNIAGRAQSQVILVRH